MRAKQRSFIWLLFGLLLALAVFALTPFNVSTVANAQSVHIAGGGEQDSFSLTEQSYAANEKFVFTTTVQFENGQAAGIVFGAQENERYWVFNVDRKYNAVKLIYFYGDKVEVLEEAPYVGSSLMNDGEKEYVKTRTSNIEKVYLKVIITPETNGEVYAEFYADGIRRFAYTNGSEAARDINLNEYKAENGAVSLSYAGGKIGYNAFNADVNFIDTVTGKSDYSYYTETYRNQYHFSQFAHWNNDPNGLVYYNGYYHVYFQHNPYGNTWNDMHWGHARSTDLVHWELLPIALVPDYDLPEEGDKLLGAMWSGSAMVYHKGDSATIDGYNWFDSEGKTDGDALGLIGYYSWWNLNGGNRYQVLMYSTDGGLSWNKRNNIKCTVSKNPGGDTVTGGSWRDPKVFRLSDHGITGTGDYKWGMALTNMEGRQEWGDCDGMLYFLKSKDLVTWTHAGSYWTHIPECPDVVRLTADDATSHTLITFTSRYYVVCDLEFEGSGDDAVIVIKDTNGDKIETLGKNDAHMKKMEYGVDSYACQTFYIDDLNSAYYGKSVSMAWFSGVPKADASIESGTLQGARKVWNGGGLTIPVIYGLTQSAGDYKLTVTPIVKDDPAFGAIKTQAVSKSGFTVTPQSDNVLQGVSSHCFELKASVSNASKGEVSFKINQSADKAYYTEIGWNETDGYFVDRTHTQDAGLILVDSTGANNYARRYASGQGTNATELSFYILSDNNNVEVYCNDFTVPFYVLTFASPYSAGAEFSVTQDVTLDIELNLIGTVWRGESEETMISLSDTQISLGTALTTQKEVMAYADGNPITWSVAEGEDVASVTPTATGAIITAKSAGTAKIKAACGISYRIIEVTVNAGTPQSDVGFNTAGIVSGDWYYSENVIVGYQPGGDGFMLSADKGKNFVYSANFDLGNGPAAAIVFRATAEEGKLKNYLIANYDNNSRIVKLWSKNHSLLASANVNPDNVHDLTISVNADGRNVTVFFNGAQVINTQIEADDPLEGYFGLNVCATRATFFTVSVFKKEYDYSGSGGFEFKLSDEATLLSVTNRTLGNALVAPAFYDITGEKVTISDSYFELLPKAGDYIFTVVSSAFTFDIVVTVAEIPATVLRDITVNEGSNAVIYVGNVAVQYVKINDENISADKYSISNRALIINAEVLDKGENLVEIASGKSFIVTVNELDKSGVGKSESGLPGWAIALIVIGSVIGAAGIAFVVLTIITKFTNKSGKKQKTGNTGKKENTESTGK